MGLDLVIVWAVPYNRLKIQGLTAGTAAKRADEQFASVHS